MHVTGDLQSSNKVTFVLLFSREDWTFLSRHVQLRVRLHREGWDENVSRVADA